MVASLTQVIARVYPAARMDTKPKLARVDEFDSLRGLLATWVAVSHILCWTGFAETVLPRPFGRFWPDFISAQPAVEIFIILSGFAISFY